MQCRRMCAEGHAQRPGFHEFHDCLDLMEAQGQTLPQHWDGMEAEEEEEEEEEFT